jgi:hypothetical protein
LGTSGLGWKEHNVAAAPTWSVYWIVLKPRTLEPL